jgi:hypothetical protein
MNPIFPDIAACSPLKVNQSSGGTCRLHLQGRRICQARNQHETGHNKNLFTSFVLRETFFILVSCLAFSSILKMKTTCSSETSAAFQRTTWRYIPEDRTLTQMGFKLRRVIMRLIKTFADKRPRKHILVHA